MRPGSGWAPRHCGRPDSEPRAGAARSRTAAFLGPVCLSEGGVAERRAGGPGYTRCLLEPALRVGELACSTGHPVWHGPVTSAGSAGSAGSRPGSLRFPDAGAGCLICVTSSGPCAPSALWASSWGSERLRSLCRASWDDPRPHSTPNPRPLRPRGALLASRVACPNPPLGCTRKCPLGASRMGPHLDSSPGHSDRLAGARPGHQPDSGPALRRPQSRPRRLRRGDPPSAASQGRGLDPRNRSVPQASLVVGAFLF